MLEINLKGHDENLLSTTAFIFYSPQSLKNRQKIFFNQEALQILSNQTSDTSKNKLSPNLLSSLCTKWMNLLQTKLTDKSENKPASESMPIHLGTIMSYRRRYSVKGIILYPQSGPSAINSYIFIIQRFAGDNQNLLKAFRKYQLSNREREIIKLLINGESNKQIAYSLGLSPNTIKSYMKLIMTKLGASNRSGIITAILSEI